MKRPIANNLYMKIKHFHLGILILSLFIATSCDDDDPVEELPAINANFTSTEGGISESATEVTVEITFSRPIEVESSLSLQVSGDLAYGENADYFTTPAMTEGVLTLTLQVGDETASFKVSSGAGLNIAADAVMTFTLLTPEDELLTTGTNTAFSLSFSENFLATSGTIELNAGGENFTQQAFVDLSKNTQTTYTKHLWDLAFSNSSGFYVKLNAPDYVMARKLDVNDLLSVTAEDTITFAWQMTVPQFDPSLGSNTWVDTPDGNLETSAFGAISSTDSENQVFIIKRDGDGRNWKKVRVLQSAGGYSLQYADINATTFETLEIAKSDTHNFVFVDLDDGIVEGAPEKDKWDLQYGTFTELLNLGGPGLDIPYGFKDFITINTNNTSVAMVMTEDFAYDAFESANVSSITFMTEADAIGENWRMGGGPGSAPALYEDRFFVIKDSEENHFKLRFTRLTSTTGERGLPEFTFELL